MNHRKMLSGLALAGSVLTARCGASVAQEGTNEKTAAALAYSRRGTAAGCRCG